MWYDAKFLPKADSNAFFETNKIEEFTVSEEELNYNPNKIEELAIGVDVAGQGNDRTVFTYGFIDHTDNSRYKIIKFEEFTKLNTRQIAEMIYSRITNLPYVNTRVVNVTIDSNGMGEGVVPDLQAMLNSNKITNRDVYIYGFKGSRKANRFGNNCANAKSELLYQLGREVERDKIRILRTKDSFREIRNVRIKERKGKIYVVDQNEKLEGVRMTDKSPDYFDSILYCFNNMFQNYVDRKVLFEKVYGADTW